MRNFTAKSRYALLAALDLARHRDGETPIKKQDIAWRSGVPPKFLAQILLGLKRAALAGSTRGANGGYWLMRPPETITAQEVINALEDTPSGKRDAPNAPCPYDRAVDALFNHVEAAELKVLRSSTLADLLAACEPAEGES
jgi:Rrf2 family protein